ncbi:MAG: HEAT repeat domain-containing protein [Nocardioidaceae bacterium]
MPETLPPPANLTALPGALIGELRSRLDEPEAARRCADLLDGADPAVYADLLPYLAGRPGASYFDGGWQPYWPQVWGARGLLYVWDEAATPVVLRHCTDDAWRVTEMCLKVSVKRELPAADAAVLAARHELPRVRAVAMRVLGACGDTEHLPAARASLDDPAPEVRTAAARAVERLRLRLDLPS